MVREKNIGSVLFDVFNYGILSLICLACLIPIIHTLCCSLSDPVLLARHSGVMLFPKGFSLKGYELVAQNKSIVSGYLNTLFYVAVGTALSILLTCMGAFVCSRRQFRLRKVMMLMIVFTMYFSGGLVPTYLVVKRLGLLNTRLSMILPSAISAWNLILLQNSFSDVPVSLEESAKIDGANDFTVLFRIFIPVSRAAIAVMVLLYAVGQWNSWFNAMIYLRDRKLYPLQLILKEILVQNDTSVITTAVANQSDMDLFKPLVKYCTVIVSIVPIILVYPFVQKHFVKGMMIGAVKG